jgi:hypothetical protein
VKVSNLGIRMTHRAEIRRSSPDKKSKVFIGPHCPCCSRAKLLCRACNVLHPSTTCNCLAHKSYCKSTHVEPHQMNSFVAAWSKVALHRLIIWGYGFKSWKHPPAGKDYKERHPQPSPALCLLLDHNFIRYPLHIRFISVL